MLAVGAEVAAGAVSLDTIAFLVPRAGAVAVPEAVLAAAVLAAVALGLLAAVVAFRVGTDRTTGLSD
ncbi:MAG: hypothetical protein ABWY57_13115 [Mycetocola sp.]